MRLSKKSFAIANGILWALTIFGATVYVLLKGGGNTLVLLQQFFWGYAVSWAGAILGLIYGFVWGFILGWLFAALYNRFTKE